MRSPDAITPASDSVASQPPSLELDTVYSFLYGMQPSLQTEATYPSSGRFYPVEYGVAMEPAPTAHERSGYEDSRFFLLRREGASPGGCSPPPMRHGDAERRPLARPTKRLRPSGGSIQSNRSSILVSCMTLLTTSHPRTKETFR